jgi:pSer/pThr/pTyr-binding forkhead associated (FHA) protein
VDGVTSLPEGQAIAVTVIRGPDTGAKFELTQAKVVIGRKRGDVVVKDRETSGLHASIEMAPDGRFILKDLGSTNGTFVDGKRVAVTEIRPGQHLKIGANYLLFTVVEGASEATRQDSQSPGGQPPALPAAPWPEPPTARSPPRPPVAPPPANAPPLVGAVAPAAPLSAQAGSHMNLDLGEPDLDDASARPLLPPLPPSLKPANSPAVRPPAGGDTAVRPSWPAAPREPGATAISPQAAWPTSPPPSTGGTLVSEPADFPTAIAGRSGTDMSPVRPMPPPPPPVPASGGLPPGIERSIYGVYLVVERGRDRCHVFPIHRQVTVLGRSGTEILINDPDISRRHAALDVQGEGKYLLRDLASTNGTLVNGVRIQTEHVSPNDKIRMGGTTLKLIVGEHRVAAELQRLQSEPPQA